MDKLTKDQIVMIISIIILLLTAMINWNIYSWLILAAIIMIVAAWYIKSVRYLDSATLIILRNE